MGNHFHLLLETPEPKLVSGMRVLMGTFAQGWNRTRMRRGHVFTLAPLMPSSQVPPPPAFQIQEAASLQIHSRALQIGSDQGGRLGSVLFPDCGGLHSSQSRQGGSGGREALRLLEAGWRKLGLPAEAAVLKKSDRRKVILAMAIREKTSVDNRWIADRLAMGHPTSVSRLGSAGRKNRKAVDEKNDLLQGIETA
jgi:hypothetical protein